MNDRHEISQTLLSLNRFLPSFLQTRSKYYNICCYLFFHFPSLSEQTVVAIPFSAKHKRTKGRFLEKMRFTNLDDTPMFRQQVLLLFFRFLLYSFRCRLPLNIELNDILCSNGAVSVRILHLVVIYVI